ncbi:hypothetical protein [Janthinobacterium sp.]|uniref:hypothetical protein n=1 Tax=Janthinobacterium sp. TaxID=1871054 RepID=UPI00293D5389|nr:hypothetical protein [Janthinobacterium sp.]
MTVNAISSHKTAVQSAPPKPAEATQAVKPAPPAPPPPPLPPAPVASSASVNTSGQQTGTRINTTA